MTLDGQVIGTPAASAGTSSGSSFVRRLSRPPTRDQAPTSPLRQGCGGLAGPVNVLDAPKKCTVSMPPPLETAELPDRVLSLTVSVPLLKMPPPKPVLELPLVGAAEILPGVWLGDAGQNQGVGFQPLETPAG